MKKSTLIKTLSTVVPTVATLGVGTITVVAIPSIGTITFSYYTPASMTIRIRAYDFIYFLDESYEDFITNTVLATLKTKTDTQIRYERHS